MDNENTALRTLPSMEMRTLTPTQMVAEIQERRAIVMSLMEKALLPGIHYGKIPGCGDKPSLFLAGAETMASVFMLAPKYKITTIRDGAHREYEVTCELYTHDGRFVGSGESTCSTMESKYRWRNGERSCPKCEKTTIIKGKEEYGGGWICFAKKGGCGAKYRDNDPAIVGQKVGREENPDIADQYNTCKKMGCKRAFVHAVRTVTGTADIFTQDIEDFDWSRAYGTIIDADVTESRPEAVRSVDPTHATDTVAPHSPTPTTGRNSSPTYTGSGTTATGSTDDYPFGEDDGPPWETAKPVPVPVPTPIQALKDRAIRAFESVGQTKAEAEAWIAKKGTDNLDRFRGFVENLEQVATSKRVNPAPAPPPSPSKEQELFSNWKEIEAHLVSHGSASKPKLTAAKDALIREWLTDRKTGEVIEIGSAAAMDHILTGQRAYLHALRGSAA